MKKLWDIITWPYRAMVDHYKFKKRLKELRKKDPFTYK